MSSLMYVPRPVRDVIESSLKLNKIKVGTESDGLVEGAAKSLISWQLSKTIMRVALAAIGIVSVVCFRASLPVCLILGGVISLPSVALAGGGCLLYYGSAAIIGSVGSGALSVLAVGFMSLIGGWFCLENHDVIDLGFLEV